MRGLFPFGYVGCPLIQAGDLHEQAGTVKEIPGGPWAKLVPVRQANGSLAQYTGT